MRRRSAAGDGSWKRDWSICRSTGNAGKVVGVRLLPKHDYRLRANVKQHAGKQHPERDRQMRYIHERQANHQAKGHPVISVDTKKKQLVGNFKNAERTWCQEPEVVNTHLV
jgi:hypothetical protein